MFSYKGKPVSAHRFSYTLASGEIPEGLLIRHSNECVSRACVNPDHLMVGTQWDNMQDRRAAGGYPIPQPKPEKIPQERKVRRLSHQDIAEILKALEVPYRGQVNDLARKYGVKHNTISAIKHGRRPVGFGAYH